VVRDQDALPDEPLGDGDVCVHAIGIEPVPGRARQDRVAAAQHLAQVRHVALQRVQHRRWLAVGPDHVGEPVVADDVSVMQREHRQHRLAAQPAHRPGYSVYHRVNRPEKSYPHPLARPPADFSQFARIPGTTDFVPFQFSSVRSEPEAEHGIRRRSTTGRSGQMIWF
jgi:hypothetical protein